MSRLLAAAVSLALTACGGFGIAGNGKRVTQAREVPAFSSIEVHSAIEVIATKGDHSVSLTTDENITQYIETLVTDGRLVLRVRPDVDVSFTPVKIEVSNDRFEGISASGASSVTAPATAVPKLPIEASGASTVIVSGVDSATVTVDASGASTVKLEGKSEALSMNVTGASTVRARPLSANTATLTVEGASLVDLTAATSVTGHASGASTVEISGAGTMNVTSSGASTVRRSN
ncbi:MAG: DUF2807 domain-containing protein [Myxococcaceae bacterium]